MTEIEKLRERYDLQVQINRSLVEACAKSQDEVKRLRALLKGRKVLVKRAAIWRDGKIVGYRDYEYKNPKGPV